MTQYLLPMARNTVTAQTVKTQDLTGARFTMAQRVLAEDMAQQLAHKMTARTGVQWQGFVQTYTPTVRRP
jgi:nitrate/TMAO reductase-like tetraheme cytochrome c subunit